jgi:hypothetical protein
MLAKNIASQLYSVSRLNKETGDQQNSKKDVISPGKARTFNLLMCNQAGCG